MQFLNPFAQKIGGFLSGMAGDMFGPYIDSFGPDPIGDYQRDVDRLWGLANSSQANPYQPPGSPPTQQGVPGLGNPVPIPPVGGVSPGLLGPENPQIPPNPAINVPPDGMDPFGARGYAPPEFQAPGWFDNEPTYAPGSMVEDMQPPQLPPPPPPSPFEQWDRGYEADTEARWHQMRESARNRMFIEMGQALMANSHDPSMALVGAGEAAKNWGAAKSGLDQFRDSRDDRKMDTLYKLRQMQNLGRDDRRGRPQILSDGTAIVYIGDQIYKVEPDDSLTPINAAELGQMREQAEDSEYKEKEDRKNAEGRAEYEEEYAEAKAGGDNVFNMWLQTNDDRVKKYGHPGAEESGQRTPQVQMEEYKKQIRESNHGGDPRAAKLLAINDPMEFLRALRQMQAEDSVR